MSETNGAQSGSRHPERDNLTSARVAARLINGGYRLSRRLRAAMRDELERIMRTAKSSRTRIMAINALRGMQSDTADREVKAHAAVQGELTERVKAKVEAYVKGEDTYVDPRTGRRVGIDDGKPLPQFPDRTGGRINAPGASDGPGVAQRGPADAGGAAT
jgi:hypothetical protein